ncbi:MAG: hypothetical protein JO057_18400 [Chloroflexi bacterium]|nr:hypothetical protein [Chloroflexota bacterium]
MDVRNMVTEIIGKAPEGNVFPTPSELHSPQVMSRHVKELALYLDAQLAGIADLGRLDTELSHGYPFAVVCAVETRYDPYTAQGFGGQAAVQAGQFVTFILAAWIRELGYRATMKIEVPREQRERLSVAAGLGTLNSDGRLVVAKYGTGIHVADVVFTDLPLVADG